MTDSPSLREILSSLRYHFSIALEFSIFIHDTRRLLSISLLFFLLDLQEEYTVKFPRLSTLIMYLLFLWLAKEVYYIYLDDNYMKLNMFCYMCLQTL